MKKRFAAAGLLLWLLCGCLFSCSGEPPTRLKWQSGGFRAEVRGQVHGRESAACVEAVPDGRGWILRIEYLAPSAVAGMCVTARADATGAPVGEAEISWGGMKYNTSATTLAGLLTPLTCWLTCSETETLQRVGEGWICRLANGGLFTLGADGLPRAYQNDECALTVRWWESRKEVKRDGKGDAGRG
ncbi:MAG: hypothetical protein E7666_07875 [Ruminococcaceae bacterium]|nr:hypothetical protein [Oscillospiraceae bacterium]